MCPDLSNYSRLEYLTSSRVILLLSRLACPMQMLMYIVILYNTATANETKAFHLTDLVRLLSLFITYSITNDYIR